MNIFTKIIAVVLLVLGILSIYFGAYTPFVKSRRYVSTINSLSNISTVESFENAFNKVFDFYSPIGDEEITKYLGTNIVSIIAQGDQPEIPMRAITSYIELQLQQNDVMHLLIGAYAHQSLWNNYNQQESDFKKAETYYRKALAIGPKLPPVLYGLMELYQLEGDEVGMREIGNIILKYWPDDKNVKRALENL